MWKIKWSRRELSVAVAVEWHCVNLLPKVRHNSAILCKFIFVLMNAYVFKIESVSTSTCALFFLKENDGFP